MPGSPSALLTLLFAELFLSEIVLLLVMRSLIRTEDVCQGDLQMRLSSVFCPSGKAELFVLEVCPFALFFRVSGTKSETLTQR